MFRAMKYYLLTQLYRKAGRNLSAVFVSLVLLIVATMLFGDLIAVAEESTRYLLVLAKWVMILLLLFAVAYNLIKIAKVLPFSTEVKTQASDHKKVKIIEKEQLMSRSDRIYEKYRSAE